MTQNAYFQLPGEITQATEVSLLLKSWLKDRSMVLILESWILTLQKDSLFHTNYNKMVLT